MEKLTFDDGLLRLDVNGNGQLCFNPTDFNLYRRFTKMGEELRALEEKYHAEFELEESVEQNLNRMYEFDAEIKRKLTDVFGRGNDFDKLLRGVNLMSFGKNGERVITNFLNALTPYIEDGAKRAAKSAAADAVEEAKRGRVKRGARNGPVGAT